MNIRKIKYEVAVAVAVIATAFCGCSADDEEIIGLDSPARSSTYDAADEPSEKEGTGKAAAKTEETIKVYVCGAVRSPDVYTLRSGIRMIDAVNAAGGFADDAGVEYLNLAAAVSDGQKVYIPTNRQIEEAMAEGAELYGSEVNITSNSPGISTVADASEQGNSGDEKVDINHADRQTLMTLPGVGQSKADKIIAYREANGGFATIEDIMLVGGIKEGMFNKIKDSICVK